MSRELIESYFAPEGASAFWSWAAEGRALVTEEGGTIAFYQEVAEILNRLQPRGWPRFEEVVVVLMACRVNWRDEDGGRKILRDYLDAFLEDWEVDEELDWRLPLLEGLDQVHDLWRGEVDSLRLEAKVTLCEILFGERGDHLDPETAKRMEDCLASGEAAVWLDRHASSGQLEVSPEHVWPTLGWVQTVRNLGEAFRALEGIDELEVRARTGLDGIPEPADVELPPVSLSVRNLLEELEQDRDADLNGLALVAKDLMAAVHVPRALSDPDEEMRGGYSDIANRGSLDRLLISELALDDDVLATRVALNEALYLRRESPPRNAPRCRAIFLDTTVRMWGLTRIYGHAAAMALAATAEERDEVQVYSCEGDGQRAQEAFLHHRRGLLEQLSRLSAAPHPGAACAHFFRQISEVAVEVEPVVITHPAVLKDPEFVRCMEPLLGQGVYVFTVTGQGQACLHSWTAAGLRQVYRLVIREESWAGRGQAGPGELDRTLPACLRMREFPLRLAAKFDPGRALYDENWGLLARTREGLLLRWEERNRGAEMLTADLPPGHCYVSELDGEEGRVLYLLGNRTESQLVLVNLTSGKITQRGIRHLPAPRGGALLGDYLALWNRDRVEAFHLQSERSGPDWEHDLPEICYQSRGRMIQVGSRWYALAISDGLVLEQVPSDLVSDLRDSWTDPSIPPAALELARQTVSPRKRFLGAAFLGESHLGLLSAKQHLFRLQARNGDLLLESAGARSVDFLDHSLTGGRFEIVPSPSRGYSLSRLELLDGSRAWLDSRGLLHLKSSREDLPEITVVLKDGALSGWLSDGRYFGYRYFTGEGPVISGEEAAREIEKFVHRCLEE